MVQVMVKCGLNIECHHHEVATGGQCEIDQRFDTLVKSADNMMLYKYIIRNVANRSAACRIPMYSASPKAKRVEFRPPDPSANPYLAFAAMMMAGLDGVLNKINPGEPLDKDIYDLTPEEMKSVPSMPASLDEALSCLEDDHAFLMKGDVFTEELIETFIDYKRKNEADAVRLRPHPFEFALYYDI